MLNVKFIENQFLKEIYIIYKKIYKYKCLRNSLIIEIFVFHKLIN